MKIFMAFSVSVNLCLLVLTRIKLVAACRVFILRICQIMRDPVLGISELLLLLLMN